MVVAAVGSDGADYVERLRSLGRRHRAACAPSPTSYTAQAIIMTDLDNNQITAFHPGAMQSAHEIDVPARTRPRARDRRARRPRRDAAPRRAARRRRRSRSSSIRARACRCSTAPSCARFIEQATWVAVNDYEAQMLCERTGLTLEAMSRSHLRGVVVTLGAEGCELWQQASAPTCPACRRPGGRPDRLRRCLSRRAALRPGARLAAGALRRARQPPRRAEDRAAAAGRIMCWIARSLGG